MVVVVVVVPLIAFLVEVVVVEDAIVLVRRGFLRGMRLTTEILRDTGAVVRMILVDAGRVDEFTSVKPAAAGEARSLLYEQPESANGNPRVRR